jgi:hypothetical protein
VDEFWYYIIRVHDGTGYSLDHISSSVVIGTPSNNPPEAENLTLTLNPRTTDDLNADYDYYDNEGHFEAGTEIRWYKDDQLQPHINDTKIVLASETTKGETWYFTVKPKDGLEFGSLVQSDNAIIGNSPPTVTELSLTVNPHTNIDLEANWEYFDVDNDLENNSWIIRWYKDNQLQIGYNNNKLVPFTETNKGEEWNYTLNVYDGTNYSIQYNSSTTIILNSSPTASGVSLNVNPLTKDNLTVSYNFYDPDGDPEGTSWIIHWYKNNKFQQDLNNSKIVVYGNTSKFDIWYFKIQITDGEDYSPIYFSPSRIINNTAPTLTNLSITSDPTTLTTLEVSWAFHDEDSDYESTARILFWYKNGVHQSALDNNLVAFPTFTSKGEVWYYTIKVSDGTDYSPLYNSSITTILNTPSSIIEVNLNDDSTTSFADTDLTLNPSQEILFIDPDQDSLVDIRTYWYKDSFYQPTYNNLSIPDSELTKGQSWYCIVQIFDGEAWSQNHTSQTIEIINKPPTVNALFIQEAICQEFQVEDIVVNISYQFNDIDNDNDNSTIEWYINGINQPQFKNRTSIPANQTQPGEAWTVVVIPNDGYDNGTNVTISFFIESRPSINQFISQSLNDTEGHYRFKVNVTDTQNPLKDEVYFEIYVNGTISLSEGWRHKNETTGFWEYDFQLRNYSYLNCPFTVIVTARTMVDYSIQYDITTSYTYNSTFVDVTPPRILRVYYQLNDENHPNNMTFYAEIKEFGDGIYNVTFLYRYEPVNETNGGIGANKHQEGEWIEVLMEFSFENVSGNFMVYSTTIDLPETSDIRIIYQIQTTDLKGNSDLDAYYSNFSYNFISPSPDLSDLIPILVLTAIIPVLLITAFSLVRKRRQTRILTQKRKKKVIADKISDLFSLRVVICRNRAGMAFYTAKFAEYGQDGVMIAGITSAMSTMVSEIAERKLNSGEYDTLEREGFSILSYHGKYITISVVSEEKLSSYMKSKMQKLASHIESQFSEEDLGGIISPELTRGVENIVLEVLPLRLLKPLTINHSLLKTNLNQLTKIERKMANLISKIPSFIDGQHAFSAINFVSSLTVHGIPLIKAFNFLQRCYDMNVIRNFSEDELEFLDSITSL